MLNICFHEREHCRRRDNSGEREPILNLQNRNPWGLFDLIFASTEKKGSDDFGIWSRETEGVIGHTQPEAAETMGKSRLQYVAHLA